MDPRHPEQAISRMRELMKQYEGIEHDIMVETVFSRLAALERESSLVVQEICLVAPRLHEAMMQASRNRRHELSHGIIEAPVETPKPGMMDEETANKIIEAVEKVAPKPKRKTTKKKTTKKKAKK